jgi:deazaflavin-dependent oxidoreductase (nitroreductase family)
MARMNTWNMNRIRGNADKVMGMQALVLTTVGAKSGTPHHTPVAYFPDGADSWLIVASANGAAKNPGWYHNLAAHPDTVQIQIAGRTIAVNAEQLYGNDRQRGATSPARHSVSRSMSRKPTANFRSFACVPDPTQNSRSSARSPVLATTSQLRSRYQTRGSSL